MLTLPTLPDAVSVNGKNRPTVNEANEFIAQSLPEIEGFWQKFGDSVAVDSLGRPLVFFHGTANDFEDFRDGQLHWFADDQEDADQYRRSALVRQIDDLELPEGVWDVNELGDAGVRQILKEEGVDEDSGRIIHAYLHIEKLFDVTTITNGEENVNNVKEAWAQLQSRGIIAEEWNSLDPEIQWEIKSDFEGKAWWHFLEENGVYDWMEQQGYDAAKIADVNMRGEIHNAIAVFDAKQIIPVDQLEPIEPTQRRHPKP